MDDALQCMQTDLRVIFIVNFEQISHIVLIFPFWTRECPLDKDWVDIFFSTEKVLLKQIFVFRLSFQLPPD